jgi:GMP synthase-like glutamine amidotransferase
MKPILIFRHIASEGPGYLGTFLERARRPYRLISVDQGETIPADVSDTAALVFMGGPMSVNDPLPWIEDELRLIRTARAQRVPMLGHCLGAQLISKALGGRVYANSVKEIGWLPVQQADNAAARHWFDGLAAEFEVFHWHGETYTLPEGAVNILKSTHCAEQAYALDNCLAFQCHIEMTADMVREWADINDHELATPSTTVQSAVQMAERLEARVAVLNTLAEGVYGRWLTQL